MTTAQATSRRQSVTWQAVLCFLLAGLFLYNPFLNSQVANGNLAISHPMSHRATVGSSELEQFSQRGGVAAPLPDLDVAQLFVELTARVVSSRLDTADRDEGIHPQTNFSSNLWFRPPPSV